MDTTTSTATGTIRYITPAQRHSGQERAILERKHQTYEATRQRHPQRANP